MSRATEITTSRRGDVTNARDKQTVLCPWLFSKCMLYLGNVLLLYVLISNLSVSFNFHSTFLQLNVIRMLTVQ